MNRFPAAFCIAPGSARRSLVSQLTGFDVHAISPNHPRCANCKNRMTTGMNGVCMRCIRAQAHSGGGTSSLEPAKLKRPAAPQRTAAAASTPSTFERELAERERNEAALLEALRPLKAELDGKKAGEQYQGDPYFACRQLHIPVVLKDLSQANAIGRFCWLNADPSSPWIEVHEGLNPSKQGETVAFELARFYGYRDDPLPLEDPCSLAFAKAFLAQRPELVRMRTAAKYRQDEHDRAVRLAKLRAAMR